MDGNGVRRRADDEPHGFLPRGGAAGAPAWRRVVDWLFGDSEDVDQQGLLAERTLFPREPRRPAHDAAAEPRGDDEPSFRP